MTRMGRLRGWLAPALAALALCMAAPQAIAQTAVPVPKSTPSADQSAPPAATREDLQNMLETLRDPAKRDELAKQLETMLQVQQAAAPPEEQGIGASMLSALSTGFEQVGQFMENVARSFGATGNLLTWLEVQGSNPQQRAMWLEIGKDLALSLGAGALAAYVVGFAVKSGRRRLAVRAGDRMFRRIRFTATRLLLELLPPIAFGVVALAVASWAAPLPTARLALLAIINAAVISMAGAVDGALPVQPHGTGPATPPGV